MILMDDLTILFTYGYHMTVYWFYRFQYLFQNIKSDLVQLPVYFNSSFTIQQKYNNSISSFKFSEYFSSHPWSQNQMWENHSVLVL